MAAELNPKLSKLSNFELLLEYRDRIKYDHYDPCGTHEESEFSREELTKEVLARMAIGVQ